MYGFLGAGELTAAIVTGLSADVADPPAVVVSPRGREIAATLVARFPNVRVAGSNQEVLDSAPVVVLAVRPQVAAEALAPLEFHDAHLVVSALAGVRLAELEPMVGPARVVRSIPLPQAAARQSLTAIHPDHAEARALFERVGKVVVPQAESTLEAFSAATATFAAHLDHLTTIATWMTSQGVAEDAATEYVRHIFGQLGRSLSEHTGPLAELTGKHMTPGGINEQFLGDLRTADVPGTVGNALDRVLDRLRS